ncbi:hypothetical protein ON010_g1843 [Phytophthora cinnamomi]|nr:hypothetical protein ON010_g1843 [Phytophthora cinnamomi]
MPRMRRSAGRRRPHEHAGVRDGRGAGAARVRRALDRRALLRGAERASLPLPGLVALEDRDVDAVYRAMLRQELVRPDFSKHYEYLKYRRVLVDWMADGGGDASAHAQGVRARRRGVPGEGAGDGRAAAAQGPVPAAGAQLPAHGAQVPGHGGGAAAHGRVLGDGQPHVLIRGDQRRRGRHLPKIGLETHGGDAAALPAALHGSDRALRRRQVAGVRARGRSARLLLQVRGVLRRPRATGVLAAGVQAVGRRGRHSGGVPQGPRRDPTLAG